MPFIHSESLKIHKVAIDLYKKNGVKDNLDYEIRHMEIIRKFGRYPHRNEVLGRKSTKQKMEFLKYPNPRF